jgi:hypothetical protein
MIVTTPAASLLNRSLTFCANYHKGRGDRKDEDDGGIFATEQGRAKFGDYGIFLENLKDSDIVEADMEV